MILKEKQLVVKNTIKERPSLQYSDNLTRTTPVVPGVGETPAIVVVEDTTHRFVTDVEKETWNSKQQSGNYADINLAIALSIVL
jgi:hypothetical protein